MHIEKLEHLIEIAKTGSISIASQNLHISQPAISQSILKLEEELGVKIFKRSRQGAEPTVEGKKIIAKAHEVLMKYHEMKEVALSLTTSATGDLKISMIPGLIPIMLKPLTTYHTTYPNVDLEISESSTQDVLADIAQNKVDIGIASIYDDILTKMEGLSFEVLLEGRIQVVVSKNSPLAFQDVITPQELLNQTFVLYKGDHIKSFVNHFHDRYKPLKVLFTSNNPEVIKKFVADGLAISFAHDFVIQNDPYVLNGQIVALDLINTQHTQATLGWIKSDRKPFSKNANNFLQHLKSELK